jgi:hypothetical protein
VERLDILSRACFLEKGSGYSCHWRHGRLEPARKFSLHLADDETLLRRPEDNGQQVMILRRGALRLTSHQSWPLGAERLCEIRCALI